ncbi:MAG: hypothetical protein MZV63_34635 [Marinilabiliales bacterium]|nr:hypothetical protein [Marinilabiliales bacterium]
MRYPKLRELKEAVISLVTPAYTSKFPAEDACPVRRISGESPLLTMQTASGCETCANVCPPQAITFTDDKEKRNQDNQKRLRQMHLLRTVPGALHHRQRRQTIRYHLRHGSHSTGKTIVEYQEKELLICESCGAVITTVEHLHYMHRKLGPKAFASILNLSMLNRKLKLAEGQDLSAEIRRPFQRKDMFNIICPNCLQAGNSQVSLQRCLTSWLNCLQAKAGRSSSSE